MRGFLFIFRGFLLHAFLIATAQALTSCSQAPLSQASLKAFRFSFIRERNDNAAFAIPLLTSQVGFKFIEIKLAHVGLMRIGTGLLIPDKAAGLATCFKSLMAFHIKDLDFGFPAHQKSSARGMRV